MIPVYYQGTGVVLGLVQGVVQGVVGKVVDGIDTRWVLGSVLGVVLGLVLGVIRRPSCKIWVGGGGGQCPKVNILISSLRGDTLGAA